jgi:Zn-dependent alcohol dehydrogenase
MRMIAAVMYEEGLPHPFADSKLFRIQEVDLDGPGPGEVLVEVRAAGLCHSDLSQVKLARLMSSIAANRLIKQ